MMPYGPGREDSDALVEGVLVFPRFSILSINRRASS